MIAQKQTFNDLTIHLDGGTYVECRFTNCVLVYSGALPVHMSACSFDGGRFEFGGAAALAINFMTGVHKGGGQGRQIIEETFENIRRGQAPTRRAPDTRITN